jgi:hypothetical protein
MSIVDAEKYDSMGLSTFVPIDLIIRQVILPRYGRQSASSAGINL